MKKTFSILIMLVITVTATSAAFALSGGGASPDAVDVCNGNPWHEMRPHAWGTCYIPDGTGNYTAWVSYGCCWECANCYLAMITEGEPTLGQNIGKWGTYQSNYPMTGVYCYLFATQWGTQNSSSMSQFKFYKTPGLSKYIDEE